MQRAENQSPEMTRRSFLQKTSGGFVVVTLIAAGCGGGDDDPQPGCTGISRTSTATSGHAHSICIPQADLNSPPAGGASYVSSSSGHTHEVDLTAAQLTTIMTGGTVTVQDSLSDGHMHTYTLRL